MKSYNKVGIIGLGNMGGALALGFSAHGYEVFYNDLNKKDDTDFKFCDTSSLLLECEFVVLAIKPHQYEEFLSNHDTSKNIIISIAAGVSSEFMQRLCKRHILTMPNTPSMLQEGYCAVVKNSSVSNEEFNHAIKLFESVGVVKQVEESQLADYICLSGSSPAYFFNFIDALASSITALGFEKLEAEKVLAHVMKSSAQMILESDKSAKELCENVCSPNGTTIQAVNTFNDNKLEEICTQAIKNCFDRAQEMKIK